MTAVTAEPVLYIGGSGRSGSTLLELMLAQAPDVTGLGEVIHLWRRGLRNNELCGCRERFRSCPFWTEVGERAFGGWDLVDADHVEGLRMQVDRHRYVPALALPRLPPRMAGVAAEYTSYYRRIYTAVREITGGLPVDSSKHPSFAYLLARDPGIPARVVHLVRDSRGVAHSWTRRVLRPERMDGEVFMRRPSPASTALTWTAHNGMLQLLEAKGIPTYRLRYEDLLADPAAAIRAIRAFSGLPPDLPEATDFLGADGRPRRIMHSVSGNPLRFTAEPLRLRPDLAWRADMPARTRWVVTALTAPLAHHYGYWP